MREFDRFGTDRVIDNNQHRVTWHKECKRMPKAIWIEAWLSNSPYGSGMSVYSALVQAAKKAFATRVDDHDVDNVEVSEPPLSRARRMQLQEDDRLIGMQRALDETLERLAVLALLLLCWAESAAKANLELLVSRLDPSTRDGRKAEESLKGICNTFSSAHRSQLSQWSVVPAADWPGILVSGRVRPRFNYGPLRSNGLLAKEQKSAIERSVTKISKIAGALMKPRLWTSATPKSAVSGDPRRSNLPSRADLESLARDLRRMAQECRGWAMEDDGDQLLLPDPAQKLIWGLKWARDIRSLAMARDTLIDQMCGTADAIDVVCLRQDCFVEVLPAKPPTRAAHEAYLRELSQEDLRPLNQRVEPRLPRIVVDAINRQQVGLDFGDVALTLVTLYLKPRGQFKDLIADKPGARVALERFRAVHGQAQRYCVDIEATESAQHHLVARIWLLADLFRAAASSSAVGAPESVRDARLEIARALLAMLVCRHSGSRAKHRGYIESLGYAEVVPSAHGQQEVQQLFHLIETTLDWQLAPHEATMPDGAMSKAHVLTNEWEIHAQYAKGREFVKSENGSEARPGASYPLRQHLARIGLPAVEPGKFQKGPPRGEKELTR